jgi:hypothetical protein
MQVSITISDEQVSALKNSPRMNKSPYLQKLGYSGRDSRGVPVELTDANLEKVIQDIVSSALNRIVERDIAIQKHKK